MTTTTRRTPPLAFSLKSFPLSYQLKQDSCLLFGAAFSPFVALSAVGDSPPEETAVDVVPVRKPASDVLRCDRCHGYWNPLNTRRSNEVWKCVLCNHDNSFPVGKGSRNSSLPNATEMRDPCVYYIDDGEEFTSEIGRLGAICCFLLLDLAAEEDFLNDSVKSVAEAMEHLPPTTMLGLGFIGNASLLLFELGNLLNDRDDDDYTPSIVTIRRNVNHGREFGVPSTRLFDGSRSSLSRFLISSGNPKCARRVAECLSEISSMREAYGRVQIPLNGGGANNNISKRRGGGTSAVEDQDESIAISTLAAAAYVIEGLQAYDASLVAGARLALFTSSGRCVLNTSAEANARLEALCVSAPLPCERGVGVDVFDCYAAVINSEEETEGEGGATITLSRGYDRLARNTGGRHIRFSPLDGSSHSLSLSVRARLCSRETVYRGMIRIRTNPEIVVGAGETAVVEVETEINSNAQRLLPPVVGLLAKLQSMWDAVMEMAAPIPPPPPSASLGGKDSARAGDPPSTTTVALLGEGIYAGDGVWSLAIGEANETRLGFEMSHASQMLGLEDLVYPRTCAVQVACSFHTSLDVRKKEEETRAVRVLKLETRTSPRDVARTLLALRSGMDPASQLFLLSRLLLSQTHLTRGEKREILLDWCARNYSSSRGIFIEKFAKPLFGLLRAPELTPPAYSSIERREVGFALPPSDLEVYARPSMRRVETQQMSLSPPLPLSLSSLNLDSLAEVVVLDAFTHIFLLANDRHSHAYQAAETWMGETQASRAAHLPVRVRRIFYPALRRRGDGDERSFVNPRDEEEAAARELLYFLYDDDCDDFASSGAAGTGEFFRNLTEFLEFTRRRAALAFPNGSNLAG